MEIFIIREGRQAGPYSEDAVRAFLTECTARPADMGWCKGMPEWKPLAELLKPRTEESSAAATPPPAVANAANAANAAEETHIPATAKQKALLKYLGAEFGENLAKERAALAISDALETPKLQVRIRKWHDDKLRMHADLFQDEIDFRKANRTTRYLERVQTEGADVLKDVTKAHVQVLVESLDKKHPGWESEPESALWDYLLPAIGEHFPQLVQPAHKGNLKTMSAVRAGSPLARGTGAMGGVSMPPQPTGTFGAMIRGVVFGVIALGAIVVGYQKWQESHGHAALPPSAASGSPASEKKETPDADGAAADPSAKKLVSALPGGFFVEVKGAIQPPEFVAELDKPIPAAPPEPAAPAPAANAEKPAPPAAPAVPDEKPAAPAPAAPAMSPEVPPVPAPANTPPPAPLRNAVKLTQTIGVMLSNGQVELRAGTVLRYLATEGQNVRVSWNNNVFFVPAMATDVNEPVPALGEPATNPATNPPAAPAMPATKPKKPSDDL